MPEVLQLFETYKKELAEKVKTPIYEEMSYATESVSSSGPGSEQGESPAKLPPSKMGTFD